MPIEQLLRIIQSIPSKKAEPLKQWLALVGKERLEEIAGGNIANNARKELEQSIRQSVISPLNAQSPQLLEISDDT